MSMYQCIIISSVVLCVHYTVLQKVEVLQKAAVVSSIVSITRCLWYFWWCWWVIGTNKKERDWEVCYYLASVATKQVKDEFQPITLFVEHVTEMSKSKETMQLRRSRSVPVRLWEAALILISNSSLIVRLCRYWFLFSMKIFYNIGIGEHRRL
jgi:hypothetical protein